MAAADLDEGLISALHDALAADIDPGAGRHLAVHHQALPIERVERVPGSPVGDEVRVRDQHARRVGVGLEDADGLAALHEQGLVLLQRLERGHDAVEGLPVARRPADAAIDDEGLRVLGHPGSRLFMSIRKGASVSQLLARSSTPCGDLILRVLSRRLVIGFSEGEHGFEERQQCRLQCLGTVVVVCEGRRLVHVGGLRQLQLHGVDASLGATMVAGDPATLEAAVGDVGVAACRHDIPKRVAQGRGA